MVSFGNNNPVNPNATWTYAYSTPQYPGILPNHYPLSANSSTAYQAQLSQNNQNTITFQYVQGQTAAEAWLCAPGQTVYLMDSNAPVIYMKSADQNGRYFPMKTYDLVERAATVQGPDQPNAIDTTSFVKRDEITALVAKAVENYFNTPAKKGE